MKKYILFSFVSIASFLFGQEGPDVVIVGTQLRQVEPAPARDGARSPR